jgi:hypothetical protein
MIPPAKRLFIGSIGWNFWRTVIFGYDYETRTYFSASVKGFALLHYFGMGDCMGGFTRSDAMARS